MKKSTYKVKGGKMIKVSLRELKNKIGEIKITGDFFLHPEELIDDLEKILIGKKIETSIIIETIKTFLGKREAILLGASPEDFARCILIASNEKN